MTTADRRLTSVGRAWTLERPVVVTQAAVSAYARAVGSPSAVGSNVPPTFAAVIANGVADALFEDPESGLAVDQILHRSQRFTWTRPLRVGDVVTAGLAVERVRPRRGFTVVEVTVGLREQASGETLCTVEMTWACRDPGGSDL